MAYTPIANIAQRQVNRMQRPREEVEAVVASTPAMFEDIAVRAGVAPGANPIRPNLYTGAATAAADQAYMQALTRALPQYVNTYRAYQEELKKKNRTGGGDGTGGTGIPSGGMPGGGMPGYNPAGLLPPPSEYLPDVPGQPLSREKTASLYRNLSAALVKANKRTK